jgi:hypothetical protein
VPKTIHWCAQNNTLKSQKIHWSAQNNAFKCPKQYI